MGLSYPMKFVRITNLPNMSGFGSTIWRVELALRQLDQKIHQAENQNTKSDHTKDLRSYKITTDREHEIAG